MEDNQMTNLERLNVQLQRMLNIDRERARKVIIVCIKAFARETEENRENEDV
jgi:hypothetical protein